MKVRVRRLAARGLLCLVGGLAASGCTTIYRAEVAAWDQPSLQASVNALEGCLREGGFQPDTQFPDQVRVQDLSVPAGWESPQTYVTVDFDRGQWVIRFVPPPDSDLTVAPAASAFRSCMDREAPQHAIKVEEHSELDWR